MKNSRELTSLDLLLKKLSKYDTRSTLLGKLIKKIINNDEFIEDLPIEIREKLKLK